MVVDEVAQKQKYEVPRLKIIHETRFNAELVKVLPEVFKVGAGRCMCMCSAACACLCECSCQCSLSDIEQYKVLVALLFKS